MCREADHRANEPALGTIALARGAPFMIITCVRVLYGHLTGDRCPLEATSDRKFDPATPWFEMTLLRVWHALTYLGDGAVLLPCAALLFVWLIAAAATRRTAWWWLGAVLLVAGAAALSKLLYMISGWHPAGWDFIGLSGHAALSFVFFPAAAALVTSRHRTGLRTVAVALGSCLAFAISLSSWILRDHSLSEVVLGALWGALVAAIFLTITWRHVTEAPPQGNWAVAGILLLVLVAYRAEFPSTPVLSWIAVRVSEQTTIHTRANLGPQARLSRRAVDGSYADSPARHTHTSPDRNP